MKRRKLKLNTGKLAKKRKKKYIVKAVLYLVFAMAVVLGLSYFSFADFMSVNEVRIKGLETLTEKNILAIFKDKTEGKILGLFSKSNIFLYPKSEIKSEISNSFDRVSNVEISRQNLSGIEILIKERKPFGLWCQQNILDQKPAESDNIQELEAELLESGALEVREIIPEESCFYLDEGGLVFDEVLEFDDFSFIKHYGDLVQKEDGKYFLETGTFKKLHDFMSSSFSFFGVKALEVRKIGSQVKISLEIGTTLILSEDDDFNKVFENLAVFANDTEFQKNKNEGNVLDQFEHIDLRFGNKILYKLKE